MSAAGVVSTLRVDLFLPGKMLNPFTVIPRAPLWIIKAFFRVVSASYKKPADLDLHCILNSLPPSVVC